MKRSKLLGLFIVLAMLLSLVSACGTPTEEAAKTPATTEAPKTTEPAKTEEPTKTAEPVKTEEPTKTEEPAKTAEPAAVNYDTAIYGDLEALDPSGQEVLYWYQHTGSREELMLSMIDEFNRTNEWGITVVGETQGSYNDLYQKIVAGIPGKQLPSMAVAYQNQAATYAVQNVLVGLDPYIESAKWGYRQEELDDFFPISLAADYLPQFQARYGFPPYKSMEVMYYNQDWLTEMGYDGPPESWEEFEEMACKAVEEPFSGATGEGGSMGYVYSIDASRFATFVFSRGGDIISEDGSEYAFGDEAGLDTLTFWQSLTDKGCAMQSTEDYGDQTDFGNGRSLFTIGSISGLPYYGKAVDEGAKFAWSVNPPPHSTAEARMNIYGASQSIFISNPEEQLAAWLFTKWLSEAEQQALWASSTGYFPTRQSAADALADYFAENPTYQKAFGFMQLESGVESPVAGYDECRSAISSMLTNVIDGADAAEELATAVEMCNEYLDAAAPEGFEGAVKPTAEPAAGEYDTAIYGDLEALDPSGQEVLYWYQHTGSREELMLSMIDEFNRTNEWGITVVGETQGSYNDLYQKIVAGIPGKQLPQTAVAYQNQAATYAVQEVLVELDPYIESAKWGYSQEELDDFFPISLAADYLPQFKARYGFPPYKSMEVMYYNQDWLTEMGYDGPPESWEEFEEMACKAVEEPFSGATGEGGSMGYVYSIDASRFATFVFSRGGDIISEDGSEYAFGDEAGLDTLTFWQSLTDKGCAMQSTEDYGDQTDFGNGRSLFTIGSISGLPYYGKAVDEGAKFAWSVNPPPHSTAEARMNIYGASQSIFTSTPEQQLAAWLFIKWLSEADQQALWASSTGYFPTRQSAADALADYFAENPTYEKAFGFMQLESGVESPVAGYDECRSAISSMLTNVIDGADAAEELATTVETCNEYLDAAAPK